MSRDDEREAIPTDAEIANSYFENYRLSRGPQADGTAADRFWWAWETVHEIVQESPLERVLPLLLQLTDAAENDAELCYLGAGPIEDFLVCRDDAETLAARVDAVETAARRQPRFRYAVTSAWFDEHLPEEMATRLRRFGNPP